MPYLTASEVVFHKEALYQVYVPLPLSLPSTNSNPTPNPNPKPNPYSNFCNDEPLTWRDITTVAGPPLEDWLIPVSSATSGIDFNPLQTVQSSYSKYLQKMKIS